MSSALSMIRSLAFNNRRKSSHDPFSKNTKTYKKSDPIVSKDYTRFEKELLLKQLKENRDLENKSRINRIFISLGLTLVTIATIIFLIKLVFF